MVDCLPGCSIVDSDENGCGGTCECGKLPLWKQQSHKNLNQVRYFINCLHIDSNPCITRGPIGPKNNSKGKYKQ